MIGGKRPGRGSPPMLRSPAPPRVRAGATVGSQRPLSFARTTAGCAQSGPLTRQPREAPRPRVSSAPANLQPGGTRPAPRAGGRPVTGRRPHQPLRFAPSPSGWARVRTRHRAQRAVQSGIAALIWRRSRGSQSTPVRPSPSEAGPGAAAAPKRSRPHQPLTVSTLKQGASQSGASQPCSPTGPRALVSPGQPQSFGSLHQGRDRTSAVLPVRGGRHTLLWV
ncbi:hypothetical protein NDU88_004654 [Pleurodeles waltl]|uniref:Uncharacterized protein n=1 Tax=Pleurodeles waltl TaxID=8319 RepID=A0AAV7W973_PLEWA|nr:hypothetical protein NDU88_004654 [Pleurodeles waltl]